MYFNPRGPCGPRLPTDLQLGFHRIYFNPRGPCGPRPHKVGWQPGRGYFNPRGPCGPRHKCVSPKVWADVFQSSRSLRTATTLSAMPIGSWNISILAVLADRDALQAPSGWWMKTISILAVLADRDYSRYFLSRLTSIFQSSRSLRTATKILLQTNVRFLFQSSRSLRTATRAERKLSRISSQFQSSRSLRTAT